MQLHELKPTSVKKTAKRIGRGGKRGKTSGRGMKGQTARAGNSTRPEIREQIKKLPKLRGHGVNRARTVNSGKEAVVVVNLARLEAVFASGDTVSPKTLVANKVVSATSKKAPLVKILGTGEITKKLTIENCQISKSAEEKIEKAGGKIIK
ncbi:MAG: 50S ribosomal protein L15 [Candidatus Nomurabacteria bacterium]|nr:MAG: 50S ribosomal protein L15 [Candidatus Nomurabacteria bacterium]